MTVAEILKDCPKGTELYSPIFGKVYFESVKDTGHAILIEVSTSCNSIQQFYPDGKYNTYYSDSECLLFPSKENRDWDNFVPPIAPKFKKGDRIKRINTNIMHTIKAIDKQLYIFNDLQTIMIAHQDDYVLVPNKFDVSTLKPFDKVLVRLSNRQEWVADLFSHVSTRYTTDSPFLFMSIGHYPTQCIPYENNEHLLGTTNDCDDYYKNW